MARISEVMTPQPLLVQKDATVHEAAIAMKGQGIGDVLIMDGDALHGILTDRDIVIRALAEGRDPDATTVGDIASAEVHTVGPDDPDTEAVKVAREHNVKRVPVVEDGRPVGIVTLGDLAIEKDPESALADISAAPPNE